MSEVTCEWTIEAILGEGPLWVAEENSLYWVDVIKKNVHRLCLTNHKKQAWTFSTEITSLAQREQGGFIGTIRDGFAFIDFAKNEFQPITLPEADIIGNRFNDGKIDSQGRYWAGSMDISEKLETGKIYRLDGDLSLHTLDQDYIVTNGPAFSADKAVLYHTDSIKRVIYAFDLDSAGNISNKREFIHFTDSSPDGMTVDSENCIWVCHFSGARITRFSPMGEILQVIQLPCPNITSCTFGGKNLDVLYITTARYLLTDEQIQQYPQAGSLFSFKPGVSGLPTPKFAG